MARTVDLQMAASIAGSDMFEVNHGQGSDVNEAATVAQLNTYLQGLHDARYLQLTGGALTGDLQLTTKTPASAAAAGVAGTIAWDASFIYICVATNSWTRVAIAAW